MNDTQSESEYSRHGAVQQHNKHILNDSITEKDLNTLRSHNPFLISETMVKKPKPIQEEEQDSLRRGGIIFKEASHEEDLQLRIQNQHRSLDQDQRIDRDMGQARETFKHMMGRIVEFEDQEDGLNQNYLSVGHQQRDRKSRKVSIDFRQQIIQDNKDYNTGHNQGKSPKITPKASQIESVRSSIKILGEGQPEGQRISLRGIGASVLVAKKFKTQVQALMQSKQTDEIQNKLPAIHSTDEILISQGTPPTNNDISRSPNDQSPSLQVDDSLEIKSQNPSSGKVTNRFSIRNAKDILTSVSRLADSARNNMEVGKAQSAMAKHMTKAIDQKVNEEVDNMDQDIKQMIQEEKQETEKIRIQEQLKTKEETEVSTDDEDIVVPDDDMEDIDELLEQKEAQKEGTLLVSSVLGMSGVIDRSLLEQYTPEMQLISLTNITSLDQMEIGLSTLIQNLYTNMPTNQTANMYISNLPPQPGSQNLNDNQNDLEGFFRMLTAQGQDFQQYNKQYKQLNRFFQQYQCYNQWYLYQYYQQLHEFKQYHQYQSNQQYLKQFHNQHNFNKLYHQWNQYYQWDFILKFHFQLNQEQLYQWQLIIINKYHQRFLEFEFQQFNKWKFYNSQQLYKQHPLLIHIGNVPPIYVKMITNVNYFMGMTITTLSSNMVSNTDSQSTVFPQYRSESYEDYRTDYSIDVNKTLPPYNYSSSGGYLDKGGFVMFFPGNQTLNQTMLTFNEMLENNWFRNNMVETIVELMFYNKNEKVGLLIQLKFFINNAGEFYASQKELTFLPQNYESFADSITIIKLTLFVLFFTGMTFLFFQNSYRLITRIKQFFERKVFDLPWYTYIDIVSVGLCIASTILWFIVFINRKGDFYLPLQSQDDFTKWADQAYTTRNYIRVSAALVILMSVRNLRSLTTTFPAFGVLFDTIRKAKKDLIYFFIIVLIIGCAAMCMCIGFFGAQSIWFMNANSSMMTLFQMMNGVFFFDQMESANNVIAPIFFIPFTLLFYFIVMNFFSAIIMRTYDNLRQKKQLITEAMAEIIAKDTRIQKDIWLNFFLCRMKIIKFNDDSSDDEQDDKNKSKKEPLQTEQLKSQDTEQDRDNDPSLSAKCLYNLNQILRVLRGETDFKTREQFEHQLYKAKKKILLRKKRAVKLRQKKFTDPSDIQSYIKLKQSILFIFFIVVYVLMLMLQTQNQINQNASLPVHSVLTTQSFVQNKKLIQLDGSNSNTSALNESSIYFADILDQNDMIDFISQVIFPFVSKTETLVEANNLAVGANFMRLTFRFINVTFNEDNNTNIVFPGIYKTFDLSSVGPLNRGSYEVMSDFVTKNSQLQMNYSDNYDPYVTFQGQGGYEIYLPTDNYTEAQDLLMNKIYNEDWSYYGFDINGAGFVRSATISTTLYLDHFTKSNAFLLSVEVIYTLFLLYYFFNFILNLFRIWGKITKEEKQYVIPPRAGCCKVFIIKLGLDYNELMQRGPVIWRCMSNSFHSFNDFIQNLLSLWAFITWVQIISFKLDSDLSNSDNLIQRTSGLSGLQLTYRSIAHVNVFITFLRILPLFTFSKKLSTFSEILASAAYDILFFVIMFCLVNFLSLSLQIMLGFAVSAYTLFGAAIQSYSSVFLAFFSLLMMLDGSYNYSDLYNTDPLISAVFFVAFLFRRDFQDDSDVSFFDMITAILKNNLFKDKNLQCARCCCNPRSLRKVLFGKSAEAKDEEEEEAKLSLEQEAKAVARILHNRLANPNAQDYNIHKNMRSYFFNDPNSVLKNSDLSMNDRMMGNVMIYKRIEDEGFTPHDLINSNIWLYNLENQLNKQSLNKISIYDFQSTDTLYSQKFEHLNVNGLNDIQKQFLMIDKRELVTRLRFIKTQAITVQQKYDLWMAMDFEKLIKITSTFPDDIGLTLFRLINGLYNEKTTEEIKDESNIANIRFKVIVCSQLCSMKFNKVTKMQHHLWTQVFTTEDKQDFINDRIGICFGLKCSILLIESDFGIDQCSVRTISIMLLTQLGSREKTSNISWTKYNTKVIFQRNITVSEEITQKTDELEGRQYKGPPSLSPFELQRIRDKYYNSSVMLYVWNQLKKRSFDVPRKGKKDDDVVEEDENQEEKKKTITMTKKDYMEMLKSMFKLMVEGLSKDRLELLQKLRQSGGEHAKFEIYKKLKEDIFDESEYRLSLWLPLSQKEKLDMILHQRIEEEMEIMIFLLDEEEGFSLKARKQEQADFGLERALDQQIYEKYIQFSRFQAIKCSLEMCNKRVAAIFEEDSQIVQYAAYLHDRIKTYDSQLFQLKNEVQKKTKQNERKREKLKADLIQKMIKQDEREQKMKVLKHSSRGQKDSHGRQQSFSNNKKGLLHQRTMSRNSRFGGTKSQKSFMSGATSYKQKKDEAEINEESDESDSIQTSLESQEVADDQDQIENESRPPSDLDSNRNKAQSQLSRKVQSQQKPGKNNLDLIYQASNQESEEMSPYERREMEIAISRLYSQDKQKRL